MTPLEQRAADYADARLKPYDSMLLKVEAKTLIEEAYEQDWQDNEQNKCYAKCENRNPIKPKDTTER